MMANIDELNKSISAYGKYVNDKQKHDNMIYNLTQKRVCAKLFCCSFHLVVFDLRAFIGGRLTGSFSTYLCLSICLRKISVLVYLVYHT